MPKHRFSTCWLQLENPWKAPSRHEVYKLMQYGGFLWGVFSLQRGDRMAVWHDDAYEEGWCSHGRDWHALGSYQTNWGSHYLCLGRCSCMACPGSLHLSAQILQLSHVALFLGFKALQYILLLGSDWTSIFTNWIVYCLLYIATEELHNVHVSPAIMWYKCTIRFCK